MLRFLATAILIPVLAFFINEQLPNSIVNRDDLLARLNSLRSMASSSSSAAAAPKLHVAAHEVPQPAFLYVTAETGQLATDEEFNGESSSSRAVLVWTAPIFGRDR